MDHCQTFLNACRNGQKNIVRIFIERGGIDLDRRDAEGNTALHYVCREGFRDLAVLLLDEPITLRLALCSVPILGGICLALTSKQEKQARP